MTVAEARTEGMNAAENARPAEVCVVRAGAQFAALPIARVAEIVGAVQPQALPHAPWFVSGLALYRGEALTAVDLRRLLDPESPSLSPGPAGFGQPGRLCCMLVVDRADGGAGGAFGLLVDSVDEVRSVSSRDCEPAPSTLGPLYKELLTGAYKQKGRLVAMLNPDRLDPSYLGSLSVAAERPSGWREGMPAGPEEGEQEGKR
ncbi:MAG TPA: chemotaxis protein CheW [Terracidiphilus sp.]|nr:chemotaxis protein CheW [Terracidiphilus sp.]